MAKKNNPLQKFLSGSGEKLAAGLNKLSESGILAVPGVADKLGETKLGQALGGSEVLQNFASGGGGASGDISEPEATVASLVPLDLEEVTPWQPTTAPVADPTKRGTESDAQLESLSTMLSDMQAANADRLQGKISGDVADQIRVNSAESALAGGIGADSPAARALQAKDFGLTSMDIKERGLATAGQITQLQSDLTKISESRYQFSEQLAQSQRAFNEQSRQFGATLEQDAIRTQLQHKQLLLQQDMFNAEQNMRLVTTVASLVTNQAQLQVQAASNEVGDEAITAAFDDMILNIGALLKKTNKQTA